MKVTLIANTPEPQRLVETCARISYESKNDPFDPEVNSKFIRKLIVNGHESPLEHASATLLIEGVSRACSHQIVRHRLASFSQRSQRYTAEDDFVTNIPDSILYGDNGNFHGKWVELMDKVNDLYKEFVRSGVPKEDARLILPESCQTSLYMTANFREWRHFLKLRLDKHAQWEIRGVAEKVLGILSGIAPDVFDDIVKFRSAEYGREEIEARLLHSASVAASAPPAVTAGGNQ